MLKGANGKELDKADLQKLAKERGVVFENRTTKAGLIALIQQHEEAKAAAAPMALTEEAVKKMKVAQLRSALEERGLDSSGIKDALLNRLVASLAPPAPFATGASTSRIL